VSGLDYLQVAVGVPAVLGAVTFATSILCWPLARLVDGEDITWRTLFQGSEAWKNVSLPAAVWGLAASLMRPAAVLCLISWPLVVLFALLNS